MKTASSIFLALGMLVMSQPAFAQAPEPDLQELLPTEILVAGDLYFPAADGASEVVPPGIYLVELAPESKLRLTLRDGQTFLVSAVESEYEGNLDAVLALSEKTGSDEHHVVLLLPGGTLYDAVASRSGIVERGTSPRRFDTSRISSTLTRLNRQSAASAATPGTQAAVETALPQRPAAAAAKGEWFQCRPLEGRGKTRILAQLVDGLLTCTYWTYRRSELLLTSHIRSNTGEPFKSCLQANAHYKKYSTNTIRFHVVHEKEVFCSTTLTQDELNKTAYKWGRQSGANKEYERAPLGYMRQRQGALNNYGPYTNFFVCRVKPEGYALGRVVNGMCEYLYDGKVRVADYFEYLLLTADYGWPTGWPSNDESTIWIDPAFPYDVQATPKVCTTHIEAAPTDMYGKTGDLPGLFAGAACISHTAGKSFIDKNKMAGRLAGLE